LDYDVWNTATDPNLAQNFTLESFDQRIENKRALQQELGLPVRDDVPLLALISRLDWQKGLDLMGETVHRLMNNVAGEAQFVLLGSGQYHYESMFAQMADYHKEKMRVILDYRADLAPRIYAGSDMFLMPSLFEPCGLGQMIAMRYGCIPVVRATGGLVDTVVDEQTGFVFEAFNVEAFWETLARAMKVYYEEPVRWQTMQKNGYQQDFSWPSLAQEYVQLYQWALV
jgi:starch synthase